MSIRMMWFIAVAGLVSSCSKTVDKKREPSAPPPVTSWDAAAPKAKAPAKKPPARTLPPLKSGCAASVLSLAIKWIDDVGARQFANYKRGRTGLTANSFKVLPDPPDLNGDGRKDFVMRYRNALKNPSHYFYVFDNKGCPTLVAVLTFSPLFGYSCGARQPNGYCELHASQLMIHGEAQRSTYRFDGTLYKRHGRSTLGPRPRKFRPKPKGP